MGFRALIGLYKRLSQKLSKRLNHPIFFAFFGLISCYSGITLLLHVGTGWQDISLNVLKAVSAFMFAYLMWLDIQLWFKRRKMGKDEEKIEAGDS